jgi:hypothetical protein
MSGCAIRAGGLAADAGLGVASNGQGGAFLVGRFTDTMNFMLPGSSAFTAQSAGDSDCYHMIMDNTCSITTVNRYAP